MKRRIFGPRAVTEAVRGQAGAIAVVYTTADGARASGGALDEVRRAGVRIEERTKTELDAIAGDARHQGIVAIAGDYSYVDLDTVLDGAPEAPLFVALDEITDPHNLGAIVRSAVAFGAHAILTLKDRAAPVTHVVVRSSAGATEHARIVRVVNLARTLTELREEREMQIVGLDGDGDVDVDRLPEAPRGRVLVVGSEGKGLRPLVKKQCDVVARIPMAGPIESLNASVAAGIALFHVRRR